MNGQFRLKIVFRITLSKRNIDVQNFHKIMGMYIDI